MVSTTLHLTWPGSKLINLNQKLLVQLICAEITPSLSGPPNKDPLNALTRRRILDSFVMAAASLTRKHLQAQLGFFGSHFDFSPTPLYRKHPITDGKPALVVNSRHVRHDGPPPNIRLHRRGHGRRILLPARRLLAPVLQPHPRDHAAPADPPRRQRAEGGPVIAHAGGGGGQAPGRQVRVAADAAEPREPEARDRAGGQEAVVPPEREAEGGGQEVGDEGRGAGGEFLFRCPSSLAGGTQTGKVGDC